MTTTNPVHRNGARSGLDQNVIPRADIAVATTASNAATGFDTADQLRAVAPAATAMIPSESTRVIGREP
jgi:hypothetical protein